MVANVTQEAAESVTPQSTAEFISSGWALKTEGKLDEAEKSFRQAIALEPSSVEAHYGLGLALKGQDRRQDCIESFENVLGLVDEQVEDRIRAAMLKRLARGHINQLRSGDWGLEKEIWKKK